MASPGYLWHVIGTGRVSVSPHLAAARLGGSHGRPLSAGSFQLRLREPHGEGEEDHPATIEPTGTHVDPDDPRFDFERTIASVASVVQALYPGIYGDLFASGVDKNGETAGDGNAFEILCTPGFGPNEEEHPRWCPGTIVAVNSRDQAFPSIRLTLICGNSYITPDNNCYYIAPDQAFDGSQAFSYPMEPSESTDTPLPDELLTKTGFELVSTENFLIRVAGMVPVGNWDQYAARESENGSGVSARIWPLLTLWGDSDAYIEITADCEHNRFLAHIHWGDAALILPVGEDQIWLPESPVFIAIGYNATEKRIYIGASLGGDFVQAAATEPLVEIHKDLIELRFRGAPTATYPDGEVCEMEWFGGDIDDEPESPPSLAGMAAAFEDLSFLDGP